MEDMSLIAIEHCGLVVLSEVTHANRAVHFSVVLLPVNGRVDVLERVCPESLDSTDASFLVVNPFVFFNVIDKHLQSS